MKENNKSSKKLLLTQSGDEKSNFEEQHTFTFNKKPPSKAKIEDDNSSLNQSQELLIQALIQENQRKKQEKKQSNKKNKILEQNNEIDDEGYKKISSCGNASEFAKREGGVLEKKMSEKIQHEPINFSDYEIREESSDSYPPKSSTLPLFSEGHSRKSFNKHSLNYDLNQIFVLDVNEKENQQEFSVEDTKLFFPYHPYQPQLKYMQSIINALNDKTNALLQSPTGTGKTLCLLCSALSWVEGFYRKNNSKRQFKKKIIYLSRTHSQLKQVQSQLQKTCFRPTVAHFGSRDQFCIKQDFEEIKGRDLMEACSKAVKQTLAFRRKLDKNQEQLNQKQKQKNLCLFYQDQNQTNEMMKRNYKNKILGAEQIKKQGKKHGFCPYYYPFNIKEEADLIFMPYNYILDAGLLSKYRQIIEGSILIFDEAHNVPEAACQGRSYILRGDLFQKVFFQLKKLQTNDKMSSELKVVTYEYEFARKVIDEKVTAIQGLIENLFKAELKKSNSTGTQFQKVLKPEEIRKFIVGILTTIPCSLSELKHEHTLSEIIKKTSLQIKAFLTDGWNFIEALKETYDGLFQNIEKFLTFITKSIELLENSNGSLKEKWWQKQINHYRIHMKYSQASEESTFQIKLVCLSPALGFQEILKYHPRNIILTSGTLSPLSSWTKELGIFFQEKLVNDHVIESDQVHIAKVLKGKSNKLELNFSYNSLSKNYFGLYEQLVESVIDIIIKVPHGVLVIFPSYRMMQDFKKCGMKLFKFKNQKQFIFENKLSDDATVSKFKNLSIKDRGAALFCVCRGKVCEGIDFSDEYCRAVIFVGIPFPNIKDLILQEKKNYYSELSREKQLGYQALTGDEWYCLNTMRAVNQALGRVIRHKNDYGIIYLFDIRYETDRRLNSLLPQWSKKGMKNYDDFQELLWVTGSFFKKMENKFHEINLARLQKRKEEQEEEINRKRYMTSKVTKNKFKMQKKIKIQSSDEESKGQNFGNYLEKKKQKPKKNAFEFMMDEQKRKSKEKIKRRDTGKKIDFL